MKWKGRTRSSNVSDKRGMGGGGKTVIGGGLGLVILIIFTLLGGNPMDIINNVGPTQEQQTPYVATAEEEELVEFVSVILHDTEVVWEEVLTEEGMEYRKPTLVIFSGSVESACGVAGSSMGPFYCSADESVYIDLSFYKELRTRFKAPGDFAMAYVIAHEIGHHVQNLYGITDQVHELQGKVSEKEYNRYSVMLELQADYLAGVFTHHAQKMKLLEEGDLEEALNAASAIGDDTLQRQTQGRVVPDSFTHGTSEQRQRWFSKGYETGNLDNWDTFNTNDL
ncbi:MAG: metalloprotease [Candidatus Methanofastidiosa archaeon]|nr:metalloprotease [Candidatus Methanofastidiosa archaeon]